MFSGCRGKTFPLHRPGLADTYPCPAKALSLNKFRANSPIKVRYARKPGPYIREPAPLCPEAWNLGHRRHTDHAITGKPAMSPGAAQYQSRVPTVRIRSTRTPACTAASYSGVAMTPAMTREISPRLTRLDSLRIWRYPAGSPGQKDQAPKGRQIRPLNLNGDSLHLRRRARTGGQSAPEC